MSSSNPKTAITVQEIQKLDRLAIEQYKIPSLTLMENAGQAVAAEVLKALPNLQSSKVVIVCGLGNNAGDGYVVGWYLKRNNAEIKIYQIGKIQDLKNDAAVNCRRFKELKGEVVEISSSTKVFQDDISRSDIVVDAIFGVGLNRNIQEPFYSVIETMNSKAREIIAVDIPSGLDGTTGEIYGICIRATTTVTFSFSKVGFFKNQGPLHVGKEVVKDIGLPKELLNGYYK